MPSSSTPQSKTLKEILETLRAGEKYTCLKPDTQNIWEEGYAGRVLNKFANVQGCYVYLSPYVVLSISISLSLPLSLDLGQCRVGMLVPRTGRFEQ